MHLLEKLEQNRNLTLEEWQALNPETVRISKRSGKESKYPAGAEFWQPDLCTRIDPIYKLLQK